MPGPGCAREQDKRIPERCDGARPGGRCRLVQFGCTIPAGGPLGIAEIKSGVYRADTRTSLGAGRSGPFVHPHLTGLRGRSGKPHRIAGVARLATRRSRWVGQYCGSHITGGGNSSHTGDHVVPFRREKNRQRSIAELGKRYGSTVVHRLVRSQQCRIVPAYPFELRGETAVEVGDEDAASVDVRKRAGSSHPVSIGQQVGEPLRHPCSSRLPGHTNQSLPCSLE